jgi:hypothetical protein
MVLPFLESGGKKKSKFREVKESTQSHKASNGRVGI